MECSCHVHRKISRKLSQADQHPDVASVTKIRARTLREPPFANGVVLLLNTVPVARRSWLRHHCAQVKSACLKWLSLLLSCPTCCYFRVVLLTDRLPISISVALCQCPVATQPTAFIELLALPARISCSDASVLLSCSSPSSWPSPRKLLGSQEG